jgi:hypothetical protein
MLVVAELIEGNDSPLLTLVVVLANVMNTYD